MWTFKNAWMKQLTMRFYWLQSWLCAEGSLYIHLLSLLPWQGKEELCLHNLHCSHFPPLPSHLCGCHGDQQNEHDCTVRQTCRKGRRDVLFSPTMAFTLLCQRLSTSVARICLPRLCSTCRGMCEYAEVKVSPRRGIPAPGVC